MTPEKHNKYLAWSHLAHGGFQLLIMSFMMLMFGLMFGAVGRQPGGDGPPAGFFLVFMLFALVFNLIFALPSFIAAYGFLKRKPWAKTAGIVGGVMAAMNFPIGTAVCVYTFWFLFSDPGKVLYDQPAYALPPAPPLWAAEAAAQRTREYASSKPPDWR
jgi:hypothetical protein